MIQQNENYTLEDVNCNFCGSSDARIVFKQAKELYNGFPDRFDVVQCKKCKFCYTNPRPTQETMGYFYPETAGYYQTTENNTPLSSIEKKFHVFLKEKRGYYFKKTPSFLDKLLYPYFNMRANISGIPYFVPNGRLLDIGCSHGELLLKLSSFGWQTYGIEPTEKVAQLAQKLGAGHIHTGTVENAPWEDGFFDVIIMNMSLEHCHNPLLNLQKVHKLLKQNGKCIVIVPDFSGVESCLYREQAFTLQVPQHLYHFTPKSLTMLAAKAGLQKTHLAHHYIDNDFLLPMENTKLNLIKKILKYKYINKIILQPVLMLLAKLHLTSRMTVYFIKSN